MQKVPGYLKDYESLWNGNPHEANLQWFKNARFGLFIHYGLYSALGAGEWVQFRQKIPVAEYEKLKDGFTAEKFNADFITDLAIEAEMKYINLVTCHHDSFCLWNSKTEPFNSANSPCGRDLVREMAEQCAKKGLGLFTYYTFMLNWRHPYFLSREYLSVARPDYQEPQPEYQFKSLDDYPKYIEYMLNCVGELLELEYPLAGMWLDIIVAYYKAPDFVPLKETYGLIRRLRPEALIAYKQGATGEEDFASPEHSFRSQGDGFRKEGLPEAAERADQAWEINRRKHNEICTTLQDRSWGYHAEARHLTSDELWPKLEHARKNNCNLLANIGPLPDGSVHPEDIRTLKEIGKRIREIGWPETANGIGSYSPEEYHGDPDGAAAE